MGYVVKAQVLYMEENKRYRRSRRTSKEVVGCVQAVVGKNKFLVQFEYGQKKQMSYFFIVYLCLKEEVEIDDPISNIKPSQKITG